MAKVADKLWTLEEFLAFDDGTDTSYQLFEGRIVAMNPPLRGHGALVARLIRIVGNQLKPPCEVYAEAGIIPVNRRHSWYKADLIVTCTPGNYKDVYRRAGARLGGALAHHQRHRFQPQAPGLSADPVDARRPARVQHGAAGPALAARPGGWTEHGHRRSATVRLTGLPVALRMAELYDGILPG